MNITDERRRKIKKACALLRKYPWILPMAFQQLDEETREYFESLSEKQCMRIEKVIQKKEL